MLKLMLRKEKLLRLEKPALPFKRTKINFVFFPKSPNLKIGFEFTDIVEFEHDLSDNISLISSRHP